MGDMKPTRDNEKRASATRAKRRSLDITDEREIDLKLVEALERIERVRSKALAALGTMLSPTG